jgi:hypothetical protein
MDAHLDRFHANVQTLCDLALDRLPRMIDPSTGLFVFRLEGQNFAPRGASFRYTAMAAIGLERAEAHGLDVSIDMDRVYEALSATLAAADDLGDVGLALWAAARRKKALAERALRLVPEFDGLARSRGGDAVHSTELALLCAGLAEALAANVGSEREVRAQLDAAFRRLLAQRGASGLLPYSRPVRGRAWRPAEILRKELGFFDAQVYAVMAALRRDEVIGDPEAREMARAIGEHLLARQHPLGQWAWHYNARTGAVVDVYPVYSVHQDGMAPMAFLPLERALGVPATAAVARGVEWLFGQNELATPLIEPGRSIIWRSIRRRGPYRSVVYPLKLASLGRASKALDLGTRLSGPGVLEIDHELRPYHLGFCLHAFAPLVAALRADGADESPRPTLKTGQNAAPPSSPRASGRAS